MWNLLHLWRGLGRKGYDYYLDEDAEAHKVYLMLVSS